LLLDNVELEDDDAVLRVTDVLEEALLDPGVAVVAGPSFLTAGLRGDLRRGEADADFFFGGMDLSTTNGIVT
jgi:hypothetical protein